MANKCDYAYINYCEYLIKKSKSQGGILSEKNYRISAGFGTALFISKILYF